MAFPNIIEDIQELERTKVNLSDLVNLIYPIGSIYMSTNNVSPATFLGGDWEQIKDRLLLCSGDSYIAGSVGGEETVVLSMNNMPSRVVRMIKNSNASAISGYSAISLPELGGKSVSSNGWAHVDPLDGKAYGFTEDITHSQSHNNMPPYLTVYCWKRTA